MTLLPHLIRQLQQQRQTQQPRRIAGPAEKTCATCGHTYPNTTTQWFAPTNYRADGTVGTSAHCRSCEQKTRAAKRRALREAHAKQGTAAC